ncbi:MAG: hypothetical protein JXB18_14680, partial [Sedimentisphaerales bacterium]|nr:hypothetical protein [Sedimentisphaerales bacterium]
MRRVILLTALFAVVFVSTSQGLNIALSGTSQTGNQPIIDFLVENFGATVTFGDYSTPANIPADTELFIVGRVLSSGAYDNATNKATFNALTIPVVCFTSYVARPDGNRWGWHSGPIGAFHTLSGNETVVTEAGADVFGAAGAADWWNDATWGFSAPGTGTVGDGQILATSPAGEIVVAYWKAGDTSGTGAVFGSDRLLFNVPDQGSGNPVDLPNTAAGQQALLAALKLIILQEDVPHDPIATPLNPDGSVGTPISLTEAQVTLGWEAALDDNSLVLPAILRHNIYLSSTNDPNVYLVDSVDQVHNADPSLTDPHNEYGPLTLTRGVTYYWKIEEVMDNGADGYPAGDPNNIMGDLWSFIMVPATVSLTAVAPAYNVVDAGNDLVVSVEGAAVDTYQWYKIGDPDVALENGVDYAGVNTDTLTIYDVQLADEGYYYCVVTNSLPSTASNRDTGPARVMTKRLMNHYVMESMAYDVNPNGITPDAVSGFDMSMASNDTGTDVPVLEANTVPGLAGSSSLKFDNPRATPADPNNVDAQYAQIDEGMVAAYQDITISAWVYSSGGSNWNRILDFGNNTDNYVFLCLNPGSVNNAVRFAVKVAGTEQTVTSAAEAVPVGQWTFVSATLSGNTARLYVNGERVAVNTSMTNDPISFAPTTQNWIARSMWGEGDGYFNGMVDDLKIWNYGLSAQEVAHEYLMTVT